MNFGFLLQNRSFFAENIEIVPLDNYEKTISWFYSSARVSKGWCYPPLQNAMQAPYEKQKNIQCQIPSKWNQLPATHSFKIEPYSEEKIRFLLLCLGFIFGVYLSPEGYLSLDKVAYEEGKLTGVIPVKNDVQIGLNTFSKFYDEINLKQRTQFFGVLHWFLAGQSYQFEWDKFESQYKVLDGLYNFSGLKADTHALRASVLASYYSIPLPEWAEVKKRKSKLSDLRNNLAHEAIYANKPIGYAYPDENYSLEFINFNAKLIAAASGLNSNFLTLPVGCNQTCGWGFV